MASAVISGKSAQGKDPAPVFAGQISGPSAALLQLLLLLLSVAEINSNMDLANEQLSSSSVASNK
jgi:hypothetical protein